MGSSPPLQVFALCCSEAATGPEGIAAVGYKSHDREDRAGI